MNWVSEGVVCDLLLSGNFKDEGCTGWNSLLLLIIEIHVTINEEYLCTSVEN